MSFNAPLRPLIQSGLGKSSLRKLICQRSKREKTTGAIKCCFHYGQGAPHQIHKNAKLCNLLRKNIGVDLKLCRHQNCNSPTRVRPLSGGLWGANRRPEDSVLRSNILRESQIKCLHTTSSSRNSTGTPEDQDPSLAHLRSGKEFLNGPDQLLPSEAVYTWHARGAVALSKLSRGPHANIPPISVPTMFYNTVERYPNTPSLCVKRKGSWVTWTNEEYYEDVRKVAKAFIALGLERQHSVCILGFNSPEWFIADLAAIMAGGIPAGVYTTNSPESCAYIAEDSHANIYIVEDEQQLSKVLQYRNKLPHLKAVIQYIGTPSCEGIMSWQDLLKLGEEQSDEALDKRIKQIAVNQCCTLIYTSGTTGTPKGVMLSHDNITWLSKVCVDQMHLGDHAQHLVSYLPLSHIAAQSADMYVPMMLEATVYFAEPDALKGSLVKTMTEIQPTVFLAVPRVWEKMYESLKDIGSKTTGVKRQLADWAKHQAAAYNEKKMGGDPNPSSLQFRLADRLVLSKIRDKLGLARSTLNISAAAPISQDILEYFASLNIIVGEVYGMSECTGPHTMAVESRGRVRFGSIGPMLDAVSSKFCDPTPEGHGELCLGGRHVLMGYLHKEEQTKNAIDKEGWLHSEDIGDIDEDGYIYITGRIKELLITAGGENVAPVPIEDNIKHNLSCLSNAMVIGDKRKFLAVLLTFKTDMDTETLEPLDTLTESCKAWIDGHGSCSVTTVKDVLEEVYKKKNSKLIRAINSGIMLANTKAVSRAQKIQKWVILRRDFSIGGGELGPTLKLKRSVVVDKYKDIIDEIYQDGLDPNSTGALG